MVIGNHHDAWAYGAVDPSSGTATMLEVAKSLASVVNSTGNIENILYKIDY